MNQSALAIIRKNALWYSLTIVVTGAAAFAGVAITKARLSEEAFVQFNIQYSAALFINLLSLGWLSQSLNRFYHRILSYLTIKRLLIISVANSSLIAIPFFVCWWYFMDSSGQIIWPLVLMIVNANQTTFLVCRQASLSAKQAAISETLRSGSLLLFLLILFFADGSIPVGYYWFSYTLSGFIAFIYLYFAELRYRRHSNSEDHSEVQIDRPLLWMLRFGLPLCVWLLISFVWLYADRWYLVRMQFPASFVSDYVALADVVVRGTGLMFSPIVASAYPLISRLYDSQQLREVNKVIKRVLMYEVLITVGVAVCFIISARLAMSFFSIHTLSKIQFVQYGVGLIGVHALFQMSAMMHKIAEMQLKTSYLAIGGGIAAGLIYLLLYVLVKPDTIMKVLLCFSSGFIFYMLYCTFMHRKLTASINDQHAAV
jgi:O-antigen/teichoic acid export membrane protein